MRATSKRPTVAVAQYIRMSTEHQKYSAEFQAARLEEYATERGFEIVRTYADLGKSGLTLEARPGLRQLLADVEAGQAISAVLVYDVSRWGRFQDPDEAAACEVVCKRNGVAVHYCAETFENDGSAMSSLMKGLKRLMAGEYSRELSVKCFLGQAKAVAHGFHRGGITPYGLRRLLISPEGEVRTVMEAGDRRALQADRIALGLGPDEEVSIVRRAFHLFSHEGFGDTDIAHFLELQAPPPPWGKWAPHNIKVMLQNPAYAGDLVFNRTSSKLRARATKNPEGEWVVRRNAFPALVSREEFDRAQAVRASRHLSDARLLKAVDKRRCDIKILTRRQLDAALRLPRGSALAGRIGPISAAYDKVGYVQPCINDALLRRRNRNRLREAMIADLAAHFSHRGHWVRRPAERSNLELNGQFTIGFCFASVAVKSQANLRSRMKVLRPRGANLHIIGVTDNPGKRVLHVHILTPEDMDAAVQAGAAKTVLDRTKLYDLKSLSLHVPPPPFSAPDA